MRRSFALLAVSSALMGCEPDFPSKSIVDKLRILAVRSDPAAVLPGETVTLSTLVADPLVTTDLPTYEWAACVSLIDGKFEIFLPADCAVADALPVLGTAPTVQFVVPAEIADLEEVRQFTDASGAFGVPLRLVVIRGDEQAIAIALVAVALEGKPNQNPELQSFSVGGVTLPETAPLEMRVGEILVLSAQWTADSVQNYTITAQGDGRKLMRTEVLDVSWFSSVGELSEETTSEGQLDVSLTLSQPTSKGTQSRLWAVLRDGRGGVAWTERQIEVLP